MALLLHTLTLSINRTSTQLLALAGSTQRENMSSTGAAMLDIYISTSDPSD